MQTIYEKQKEFKKIVRTILPKISDEEIFKNIDRICRFQDGIRKKLDKTELIIQDVLVKHDYKAKTVRYWLRIMRLPRFLLSDIKTGSISGKEALRQYGEYRKKTVRRLHSEILEDIRKYVSRLKDQEFMTRGINEN